MKSNHLLHSQYFLLLKGIQPSGGGADNSQLVRFLGLNSLNQPEAKTHPTHFSSTPPLGLTSLAASPQSPHCSLCFLFSMVLTSQDIFKKDCIHLFLETGEGREKERERNITVRDSDPVIGCLSHAPNRGPGPQPRHVPSPESTATLRFPGRRSDH